MREYRPQRKRIAAPVLCAVLLVVGGCARHRALLPAPSGVAADHPLALGKDNPLREVLSAAGLSPDSAAIDPVIFDGLGSDKYLLRCFPVYQRRPLEIPYLLGHIRLGALEKPASLHTTMQGMLTKVDSRVRRGLPGGGEDPLREAEEAISTSTAPLADAIRALCEERRGVPLSKDEAASLTARAAEVPLDVQKQAALLVRASMSAAQWHERAFRGSRDLMTPEFQKALLEGIEKEDAPFPENIEDAIDRTDFLSLYAGAEDLALAVDKVRLALADRNTSDTFAFDWPTPLGRVLLRAGNVGQASRLSPRAESSEFRVSSSEFPARLSLQSRGSRHNREVAGGPQHAEAAREAILLCLDLDGDDVYAGGGANLSFEQPISILIDVAGNDRYEGDPAGRAQFGAGTLGYGILVDAAGNDSYTAGALALGSGLFGFGALLDVEGDDVYDARAHAQGAGAFGLGLLIDMKGTDSYRAFSMAQGFGFTKGCGYLLDLGEEGDRYVLRNDTVLYPSAQAPETHNSSVGQGCGLGRRADLTDGHSWAGGYGLLIDEGGDDTYDAAVFAQGVGYWYGLGFLLDRSGNDTYRAHWYCQGSGCHLGVGALIDRAGDDRYACTAQVAQAGAHDWGTAWFVDAGGDDVYETGDLALGAANENAIVFFMDLAGNDRYRIGCGPNGHSAGASRLQSWGTLRENQLNLGVFIDCGGKDIYEGPASEGVASSRHLSTPSTSSTPPTLRPTLAGPANNRFWRRPAKHPALGLKSELGVALDTEYSGPPPVRLDPYADPPPKSE